MCVYFAFIYSLNVIECIYIIYIIVAAMKIIN